MPFDLNSIQNAVYALEEIINRSENEKLMSALDDVTRRAVKASAIQYFEFTYELCWKFIRRRIHGNGTPQEASNPKTRKDIFRLAGQ